MEGKRSVAIFGTFDVSNYGDLLFPIVAAERLAGFGFQTIPVSPTDSATIFSDALPVTTFPDIVRRADAIHGVLIGGGEIVHTWRGDFLEEYRGPRLAETAYPSLWYGAAVVAGLADVPIAWNAPGVPVPLEPRLRPLLIEPTVTASDYVVVRDRTSAQFLGRASAAGIVPDTVAGLARVWPKRVLETAFAAFRERLGVSPEARLMAIHTRPGRIPEDELAEIGAALGAFAKAHGLTPVLVGIGPSLNDDVALAALAATLGVPSIDLGRPPSLVELASVIALSAVYVGTSMHGYVTAAAYDTPGVIVARPGFRKYAGFADHIGRPQDVVRSWAAGLERAAELLAAPQGRLIPDSVHAALDTHWQRVAGTFRAGPGKAAERMRLLRGYLEAAPFDFGPLLFEHTVRLPLKRALEAGDIDTALAHAEAVAAHHPDRLSAHLLTADVLEHQERFQDALAHLETLRPRFADKPQLAARLAVALGRVDRGEEAIALDPAEVAPSNLPQGRKTAVARLVAVPQRRSSAAARLLAEVAEGVPDDARVQREAGVAAASVGDFIGALRHLAASDRIEPVPVWVKCVQIDAMKRLAPYSPEIAARVAPILLDALRRHPREPNLVRVFNRLHLPDGPFREGYAVIRATAPTVADSFYALESAIAALAAGERDFAHELLAPLEGREDKMACQAMPLLALLRKTSEEVWQRARLEDDRTREMQVVRVPGAKTTLIVFLTVAGNFMMLPTRMLDALLAELPANIIYMRDTTSPLQGAKGFASLGPIDESVAAIAAELAALGAPHTLAIGASASGFSAIRYGARLKVEHVVTYAPLTSFAIGATAPGRRALKGSAPDPATRFGTVAEELAAVGDLPVDLYYGADSERDREHAARIAGLPGVDIVPLPGIDHHYCALSMMADGQFLSTLRRAMPSLQRSLS